MGWKRRKKTTAGGRDVLLSSDREDRRKEVGGMVISDGRVIQKFTKEKEMDVGLPPGVTSEEACEDLAELGESG